MTGLRGLPHSSGDDLLPPGMPRDIVGIPGISGGGLADPGGHPGLPAAHPSGMHVGPHDPLFAGRNPQRPGFGLPEGPVPGARYDPINPAGLEVRRLGLPTPNVDSWLSSRPGDTRH